MNKSRIEWCDYTWNPITGCRHGCPYCYAKGMTARFSGNVKLNLMAKGDYSMVEAEDGSGVVYVLDSPMLNETGHPLVYPFGFEPTFHRYRINALDKIKMGNNIFVGAMADMFGAWVPEEALKIIFHACMERPIHNYLFLTKNPGRYGELAGSQAGRPRLPKGDNFWYGSTLTRPEDKSFTSNSYNTFWSIEPIHAPFRLGEAEGALPGWIIIGAETGQRKGKVIPRKEWIEDIVVQCGKTGIPVFMKDSLVPVVGEENMQREYPPQLQKKPVSKKMEKKLYALCAGCKTMAKKSGMVALLARSTRGEMPKQFGYMCKECFKAFCTGSGLDIPKLKGVAEDTVPCVGDGEDG